MRTHSKLKAAILRGGILVAVVAMVAPGATAAPITEAEFATLLSNFGSSGLSLTSAQAVDRLRELGVPLGDPKAPLTEKRLAEIMKYFGVPGTTSRPGAFVDTNLASAAASVLITTSLFQTGQELSKVPPQPADLAACLFEPNRGQCKKCCRDEGTPAKTCGTFCQDLVPPSGSEPLP